MATPNKPKFGGGNPSPPQNRQIPLYDEQELQAYWQNVQNGNQPQPPRAIKKEQFGGNPKPERKRGLLDFLFVAMKNKGKSRLILFETGVTGGESNISVVKSRHLCL